MTSQPLSRLEKGLEGQEGNHASSEIPSLGRITYRDLGLTLLPGSQIIQQDDSCSRPEVKEDAGGRGLGRLAENDALLSPEIPVQFSAKEVARGSYDAKRDASKTLDKGLWSLSPLEEVAAVTQTQQVPSATPEVEGAPGPSPNPERIGQSDSAWAAGDDDIPVKIIYARKRRRVEAPPVAKVVKPQARRPKRLENPSSENPGAVSEPHSRAGGSQNVPHTFVSDSVTSNHIDSITSSHISAISDNTNSVISRSTSGPPHRTITSNMSYGNGNMTEGHTPQHQLHHSFPGFQPAAASNRLTPSISSDNLLATPSQDMSIELKDALDRGLDALRHELFPRLQNNQNMVGRVLGFIRTFPVAGTQHNSLPMDVRDHSLRHALHNAKTVMDGQKAHFDQHKQDYDRDMKILEKENGNFYDQIQQLSQQLKNIEDAKKSQLNRMADMHTALQQTKAQLQAKTEEYEKLKAQHDALQQHLNRNQPRGRLSRFLPGNETSTAASQSQSSPNDSNTSRRTSATTIDLTGDDNVASTAPTSTSGSSSPVGNQDSQVIPATNVPAKRRAPSWCPNVYNNPAGIRPQTIAQPKKQRTNGSRPSTAQGLSTAATGPYFIGEVAPSPAAFRRLEKVAAKEEEKKRKAAEKEAERARKDAEKEELRRAKQLESKQGKNERSKVTKKANKETLRTFTPAEVEEQQRLLDAAGASATMAASNDKDSSLAATSSAKAAPTTATVNVEGGRNASSAGDSFGHQEFAASSSAEDNEELDYLFEGDESDHFLYSTLTHYNSQEEIADQNSEIRRGPTNGELSTHNGDKNIAEPKVHRGFIPPADSQPIGLVVSVANFEAQEQTFNPEANTDPALTAEELDAQVAKDIEAQLEAITDQEELVRCAATTGAHLTANKDCAENTAENEVHSAALAKDATKSDGSMAQITEENEDFFGHRLDNYDSPGHDWSDNSFFNDAYPPECQKSRNYESSEESEEE